MKEFVYYSIFNIGRYNNKNQVGHKKIIYLFKQQQQQVEPFFFLLWFVKFSNSIGCLFVRFTTFWVYKQRFIYFDFTFFFTSCALNQFEIVSSINQFVLLFKLVHLKFRIFLRISFDLIVFVPKCANNQIQFFIIYFNIQFHWNLRYFQQK